MSNKETELKTYSVSVGGVCDYEADFYIEASSHEEAIRLVAEGEGEREQFFASEEFEGETTYYIDGSSYTTDGRTCQDGELKIEEKKYEDEDEG